MSRSDYKPREISSIKEIFGINVFGLREMKERLPKGTFKSIMKTINDGAALELQDANVIANTMKDWAIEKGATHYTHWFQPLTGITAEKHDAFLSPTLDGEVMTEFSGKDLIKGEPDASSFPSGGLRATFEARGYTAWDCTSPAFLKEDTAGVTLCIPTAFCSYTGEVLDKKTPLLRSMESISREAVKLLHLFGNTSVKRVITTVGPEQEYFLIDKEMYDKRKDLIFTGRTLFGSKPPKGQELEDHYFGAIKERVAEFMKELDIELWKLGVSAKTKHNEVAPSQHELAPVFTTTNIAVDHNQLVMETMKKIALRHGLVCLLHEKPFAGVNGSGKHNNWSLSTDSGQNLLEPGKTPAENAQFLLFLSACIKAVDDYPELLRVSAANPGNDHRLGANEAPPAIISIYLGEQLTDILEKIAAGDAVEKTTGQYLKIGVTSLPALPKDSSDRNRTSPFAFTGNKFEFRMVPSSASISPANFTLNVIVSEVLSQFSERLEKATDINAEVQNIIKDTVKNHKRIIYNGNNYSDEWLQEAEKRGLPNITNSVDSIPAVIQEKSIFIYEKHKVMNRKELESRYEISLEHYIKSINIEALTMIDMSRHQILPSTVKYMTFLADSINSVKATGVSVDLSTQTELLQEVSTVLASFNNNLKKLDEYTATAHAMHGDSFEHAKYYRDSVLSHMAVLRVDGDRLEELVGSDFWPFPTYSDILYSV